MTPQQKALVRKANGLLSEAIGILQDLCDDETIDDTSDDYETLYDVVLELEDEEGRLEDLAPSDEPTEVS